MFFDSGATPDSRFGLVHDTPEIGDDGTFDHARLLGRRSSTGSSRSRLQSEILPAHIVGKKALGIEDNEEAKQAVLDAIQNEDDAALAPISSFWNSGFNFTEMPDDPELVTASGPYMISDFVADQYITLTANPEYKGDNTAEHRGDHGPVHPRPARRRAGARERRGRCHLAAGDCRPEDRGRRDRRRQR